MTFPKVVAVLMRGDLLSAMLSSLQAGTTLSLMTNWEYLTVPLIVHATKQILDNHGRDGWELVQVLSMPAAGPAMTVENAVIQAPSVNLVAYFKRPLN